MDYTEYVIRQRQFEKACQELGRILSTVKCENNHLVCNGNFSKAVQDFMECTTRLANIKDTEEK